jgi:phosphatidylglycerophosphatase C
MTVDTAVTAETIIYDLDGTLIAGDSGYSLLRFRLRQSWWRGLLGIVVMPLALPLVAVVATRRIGTSIFLWIASVGQRPETRAAIIDQFLDQYQIRRIEPIVALLRIDLAAGHKVAIATGSFQELAERVVASLDLPCPPIIAGSTLQPFAGGLITLLHANGIRKLHRMTECGLAPPFAAAYSDSSADLPLLLVARSAHWVTTSGRVSAQVRRQRPDLIVHAVDSN